jgi:hypothetical protein
MKLDLNKGVYLCIEGELGKYNSIPIDNLIKFAHDFQDLLISIARYDLPSVEAIDLNNFKIELTDFKAGKSAIPQFAFTKRIEETLGSNLIKHRDTISERFEKLMDISDKGDYYQLRNLYPEPFKRNIIIDNLYSFTNDFDSSPVSFVDYIHEKREYQIFYKINRFKPAVKNELIAEISEPELFVAETDSGYAKVRLTKTKKGKKQHRIMQLYTQKNVSLNYAPDMIVTEDRKYILKFPIRCFFEKEDDYYIIQSEMLDIIGTGKTSDDAERNFSQEFDFIYNRYNELPDEQLSEHLRLVKTIMNQIVDTIERT